MSEDIIKDFVNEFVKFEENKQLERAKETKEDFKNMNTPTLLFVRDLCDSIINKRKFEGLKR